MRAPAASAIFRVKDEVGGGGEGEGRKSGGALIITSSVIARMYLSRPPGDCAYRERRRTGTDDIGIPVSVSSAMKLTGGGGGGGGAVLVRAPLIVT